MSVNAPGLAEIKATMAQDNLTLVDSRLRNVIEQATGVIHDTCLDLLAAGGKRIRPLLLLMAGRCFGPLGDDLLQSAVAAELIHMASLIHDDVIDHASTRRGRPTINAVQGNLVAVLTGDYLFAEAFRLLAGHKLLDSMKFLVHAIQEMCDGEVKQAMEAFSLDISMERYFSRINKKTGVLLAACCQAGAATAGASEAEVELLGEYGMQLGYAFQIIDDLLDFTGEQGRLGKPVGADLRNGNITLPVILLAQRPEYRQWLEGIIASREINDQDMVRVIAELRKTGVFEAVMSRAVECGTKAKASLETIPASPAKTALVELVDKTIYRDF